MSDFNLESLSCETLRRRRNLNADIGRDQRLRDSLRAQIRKVEVQRADKQFELDQIGQPPIPGLPSPEGGRSRRRRRPGLHGIVMTAADAVSTPVDNAMERRRLKRDIRVFDKRLRELRQDLFDRQGKLNDLIAGRALIITALRNKGC